jgi:hypothetical protein
MGAACSCGAESRLRNDRAAHSANGSDSAGPGSPATSRYPADESVDDLLDEPCTPSDASTGKEQCDADVNKAPQEAQPQPQKADDSIMAVGAPAAEPAAPAAAGSVIAVPPLKLSLSFTQLPGAVPSDDEFAVPLPTSRRRAEVGSSLM